MKRTSLIGHVIELLDLIRPLRQPADAVVADFFRARRYLGSKDRRFVSEAVYEILRNYKLLNAYALEASTRAEIDFVQIPSLLIYAAFAVRIRNEEAMAVQEDICGMFRISFPKTDCGTFLSLLSNVTFESDGTEVNRLATEHSFPELIISEWLSRYKVDEVEQLCRSLNQQAPTVVRVNTLKVSREECQARLPEEGVHSQVTPLSPSGLVLNKRVNAQALQSFKSGWFEMQDEGSQLLSLLLDPRPGQTIVDACAGGGGKTLHIAALMQNEGKLYAIDVDEKRLASIRPRLQRAGVTIADLYLPHRNEEEVAALGGKADAVLVDAPCSGVGTFRRNPAAKLSFNAAYVERMAAVQRSVLDSSARMVQPGGRLVYSTCTLLKRENEDVVEEFLALHPQFELQSASEVLKNQGILVESSSKFLTLLPHKTGTDGFFAAVMFRRS